MKISFKIFFVAGAIFIIQACQNNADPKVARQEVLDRHDELMSVSGTAVSLKMSLDSLDLKKLKQAHAELDTVAERRQIIITGKLLDDADEKMSDWMHSFQADFKGKSEQEAFVYYTDQKAKVKALESLYKQGITKAETLLKRFNIKPTQSMGGHMKM